MEGLEVHSQVLAALAGTGFYFEPGRTRSLWREVLEYVVQPSTDPDAVFIWTSMTRYPALIVMYAAGVAAVAAARYDLLSAMFLDAQFVEMNTSEPLVLAVNTWRAFDFGTSGPDWARLPGGAQSRTPVSDRLYAITRSVLADVVVDDRRFQQCFDEFEYLLGLVHTAVRRIGPPGQFVWRRTGQQPVWDRLDEDWKKEGTSWPVLQLAASPLIGDGFLESKSTFDDEMRGVRASWS
jgi:hypothetical protein